jgi:PadR family transcriptional regulator AphA
MGARQCSSPGTTPRSYTETIRHSELSLTDWVVLGVIAERPTHGFAVAQELADEQAVGRVWTVRRPLVYRSIATLVAAGFVAEAGDAPGARGPQRTMVRATPRGRAALRRWLASPVDHVRDVRSEFLAKLALLERSGKPHTELVRRQLQHFEPVFAALRRRPRLEGFDAVLAGWRREQAHAVERFLRSLG